MEEYDFKREEVRMNLLTNRHNHITTCYYLLLKNKIKKGIGSVSDLISEDFRNYLSDSRNLLSNYNHDINLIIQERIYSRKELISKSQDKIEIINNEIKKEGNEILSDNKNKKDEVFSERKSCIISKEENNNYYSNEKNLSFNTENKNQIQLPPPPLAVTNNTTNIFINNLTYLNTLNQGGGLVEDIKNINNSSKKDNNNFNNSIFADRENTYNNVNTEIIEKLQNEIKNLENVNIQLNPNTKINFNNDNDNNYKDNNKKPESNTPNKETKSSSKKSSISPILKSKQIKENNIPPISTQDIPIKKREKDIKNMDNFIKKKVIPYNSNTNTNSNLNTNINHDYNTEKTNINSIINHKNTNKDNRIKYIHTKLMTNKANIKNSFFNTSMSFDQNNDYKNTTLDNEDFKREKSEDKNNEINVAATASAIAKSLKEKKSIKEKNISNNENYLIKKSVNKKFEIIKEEDELKYGKKNSNYLNYLTSKNSKDQKNHLITYNADTNNNNNSNNNTYKKIYRKIEPLNNFDQYLTSKKNYSNNNNSNNNIIHTEQNHNTRKENNSPYYKIPSFSSRLNNNINKGNSYNNNILSEVLETSNFKNKRKSTYHRNSISIHNNNYSTLNKNDVKNYSKTIRQKNISVPNAQKFIPLNPKVKLKPKLNTTLYNNKKNEKNDKDKDKDKDKVRSNFLFSYKSPAKKRNPSLSANKQNNLDKSDVGNNIINKDIKKPKVNILLKNNKDKFYKEKSVNKSVIKDSSFLKTLITDEIQGKESMINKKGTKNINSNNILSYNFNVKASLSNSNKNNSKNQFENNGKKIFTYDYLLLI
jgi:hypothetical protein